MNDSIGIDEITLERLKYGASKMISPALRDDAKIYLKVLEGIFEGLVAGIEVAVFANKRIEKDILVEFNYPATVWDYAKQQINDKWPRCKLKVRHRRATKTVNIKQYLTYPEAQIKVPPEWGKGYIHEKWYVHETEG